MALPASGAISLDAVNTELGVSATAARSLNDSTTRTLFGVASGAISMSNGYGKANQFAFTISANQTNANLRTLAVNAGWNQSSKVVATINSGIYISSNGTGTPALTVNGSFPGGVELVNNGIVAGMGGSGGNGGNRLAQSISAGSSGNSGGLALSVATAISITNNGTVGGGGGGGGGGGACSAQGGACYTWVGTGGSGGGGGQSSAAANSNGGSGGAAIGWCMNNQGLSGNAGTSGARGTGGAGQTSNNGAVTSGGTNGGNGGGWGASGSSGGNAFGSSSSTGGGGGAAGAAVSGNSNITWVATGTRLGAIA